MRSTKYLTVFLLFFLLFHGKCVFALVSLTYLNFSTGIAYSHKTTEYFTDARPVIDSIDNTGLPIQLSMDFVINNHPVFFTGLLAYIPFSDRNLTHINLGLKYPVKTGAMTMVYEISPGFYQQTWCNDFSQGHFKNRSSNAIGLLTAFSPRWEITKRWAAGLRVQLEFINQNMTLIDNCAFAQIKQNILLSGMVTVNYRIGKL